MQWLGAIICWRQGNQYIYEEVTKNKKSKNPTNVRKQNAVCVKYVSVPTDCLQQKRILRRD
jgi:hypothetical protein